MIDIETLSRTYGVNAERGADGNFPRFFERVRGKRVLAIADRNTAPLATPLLGRLGEYAQCGTFVFPSYEPVADERAIAAVKEAAQGYDYLLAVGAGTLNDIAKYVGFLRGVPSGIFATAPSMDGFSSGVTPLIEGGFKITRPAQVASDVLIDLSVLAAAPRMMIGAGVGDILAKDCCLTDWKISSLLTGESYNEPAAALMYEALGACKQSLPAIASGGEEGVARLMDALLVSGYAMVVAGNSRPASGAEHHMSHFLEMDFLRRGERIPLHGVKVGLGTAVSLYLYRTLSARAPFEGCEAVYEVAKRLPSEEWEREILRTFGCPTRFSELGVAEATVRDMFTSAYRIRDRFTVLTLYCTYGMMTPALVDELVACFY